MQSEITWSTEKRKIKDLQPLKNNPRKMSKEQARHLMDSLNAFNYVELVAINADNTIIAGHMRIAAMKKLGWSAKEIEVRVPNRILFDSEVKEYCVRSNKNTGDWDWDILAAEFDPKDLMEWGFSAEELADEVLDLRIPDDDSDSCDVDKCDKCGQKIKKKKVKNDRNS